MRREHIDAWKILISSMKSPLCASQEFASAASPRRYCRSTGLDSSKATREKKAYTSDSEIERKYRKFPEAAKRAGFGIFVISLKVSKEEAAERITKRESNPERFLEKMG